MADNGKLYPGFDNAFVNEMKKLCADADYLLPNITEACFLTGMVSMVQAIFTLPLSLVQNFAVKLLLNLPKLLLIMWLNVLWKVKMILTILMVPDLNRYLEN